MTSLRMLAYSGTGEAASGAAGSGAGSPTLVVLQGLGTSVDMLRQVIPRFDPFAELARPGFNVLVLDWPGHGRSGGDRGHLTYRLAMEAAATAVDVASERWGGPVVLVGLALGGTLGCYAAVEDDRVAGVVSHGLVDLRNIRPVLRRFRQQAVLPVAAMARRRLPDDMTRRIRLPLSVVVASADRALDPRLSRRLRRHPQAVGSYDLQALGSILLTPEDKPSLAALTTPTLVVIGGDDRVSTATAAHAASSQVPGLRELWVLPAAGHQLFLEHPGAVLGKVESFVREVTGAEAGGDQGS